MKVPYQPKKPRKPTPPSKTFQVQESLLEGDGDMEVSLSDLIAKIPKGVSSQDVKVSTQKRYDEYDDYCYVEFDVYYNRTETNKTYKEDLKKYQKKLALYNEKLKDWKTRNEKYLIQKEAYDKWYIEQEMAKLQAKIKKLRTKPPRI